MKKAELITINHFRKFLGGCEFLIWNDFPDQNISSIIEHDLEIDGSINWFSMEMRDDSAKHPQWSTINTDSQISQKCFSIIEEKFINYLLKHHSRVIFLKSKNKNDLFEETLEIIENNEKGVIYNPVFIYKNAVASPTIYDIKSKKIGILKASSSTKYTDYVKPMWISKIVQSLKIKVKKIVFFISAIKDYEKTGDIDFEEIEKLSPLKSSNVKADKNTEIMSKEYFLSLANNKKEHTEKRVHMTLSEIFIEGGSISKKSDEKIKKSISKIQFSKFSSFHGRLMEVPSTDILINKIFEAKKIKNLDSFCEKNFNLNNYFNSILYDVNNYKIMLSYMGNKLIKYSGKVWNSSEYRKSWEEFNKKNLGEKGKNINKEFLEFWSKKFLQKISKLPTKNKFDKEDIEEYVKKTKKYCVWYDFEGFSLPISAVKHFLPYRQIVFQCSVIKTNEKIELSKKNLIFDPKKIDAIAFKKIITAIHDEKADSYVVYNKAYEITRLKEIIGWLKAENDHESQKMEKMVDDIEEKTLDLMNLFVFYSVKRIPPIWIEEFKGKYSIKNVEKFVTKNKKNLIGKVRFIKEYRMLDVQNGMMAMNIAIRRNLNIIRENEWLKMSKALKIYCENDVRAMIMVSDFAETLI